MTTQQGRFAVGIDGSEGAKNAALWAAALAVRCDATLQMVHGMPEFGHSLTDSGAMYEATLLSFHAENADTFLREAALAVETRFPEVPVTTESRQDPVGVALLDASKTARFIVVSSTDVAPSAAVLLGSTTLKLCISARCPVVVWRGSDPTPTVDPIVVGVDDTPYGRAALATGFAIADALEVPLHAVHAWTRRRYGSEVTLPIMIDWEKLEADEFGALTRLVEEYGREHPGVDVRCHLEADGPARTLISHSQNAQLVIVGNRGRSLLSSAFFGSTTLNLLHHSKVPLVVCHADDV